jgi:hypothetical protein
MAGGGDDHVVAGRIVLGHVVAADPRIRDHGREIGARLVAAVVGDGAEVRRKVLHHGLHHGGELLRGERLADPRGVGVLRTEQFLRQPQHAWLVGFRHAQDLHDHVQGIAKRDVGDEIARPAAGEHPRDGGARDFADTRLELAEVGGHEPALGQRAVFWMIRRVHLHQRAHQVGSAGDLADALLDRARRQRGRPVGIVEQLVLAADDLNVRVSGHHPERIEPFGSRDAERVVGPQPAIGVVDPVVGIGSRTDQRRRDVGGDVEVADRGRRGHAPCPTPVVAGGS